MEIIPGKRFRRTREAMAIAKLAGQVKVDPANDAGHRETSEVGTGTQALTRAEADRRKIGVLTRMMTGDSFIVRRI